MKNLIVNADDFGLSRGVNRGIIRAYQQGVVTSTTMLVNMPAWRHAARLALDNPGLGVGLHFNITCGQPVSAPEDIPTLVDAAGNFCGLEQAGTDPRDVARELCQQYIRLTEAGIRPTHIDSHHDVHALADILPVVLAFARRVGLPVRLAPGAAFYFSSTGIPTTDAVLDKFRDRGASRPNFERLLSRCRGTVELRCHPGEVDAELEQLSPYSWQRERELAVICGFDKGQLAAHGFRLMNFSALQNMA